MDAVDATTHYEIYATEEIPNLTAIIIDTNPRAWAAINDQLPIAKALANILVYVNSRLAYSSTNQVAIIASHTNRAVWLYPPPPKATPVGTAPPKDASNKNGGGDVEMTDAHAAPAGPNPQQPSKSRKAANKFAQFAQIESSILTSLRDLMTSTTESDLTTPTSQVSGALTLALHYINKTSIHLTSASAHQSNPDAAGSSAANPAAALIPSSGLLAGLHARILVLSVSDSPAAQYIPTMNAVFAASHAGIPIDILSLHGSATFLQQASYITRGTFLEATSPRGLLTYLMFGFASSIDTRQTVTTKTTGAGQAGTRGAVDGSATGLEQLVNPSTANVDFRAACFCHRRVIDTGFVCSICLSIFCEVPRDAECYTCGNKLALGRYGAKPAVVQKRRKKKRKLGLDGLPVGGSSSEAPGSAVGTPRPF